MSSSIDGEKVGDVKVEDQEKEKEAAAEHQRQQQHSVDDEEDGDEVENSADIHFEPLVNLPEIDVKTLEEDETVLWKGRAKIYRFVSEYDEQYSTGPQWKERGVGEVKFLQHKTKGCVRLVMRREQTLTLCANHYVLPNMKLVPHSTSNRSWMWSTVADFSEFEPRAEVLAIRFKDIETWKEFQFEFENAKLLMEAYQKRLESICCRTGLAKKSHMTDGSSLSSSTNQKSPPPGDAPPPPAAQKIENDEAVACQHSSVDKDIVVDQKDIVGKCTTVKKDSVANSIVESVAKLSVKSEEK